jgi:hypothetical protein
MQKQYHIWFLLTFLVSVTLSAQPVSRKALFLGNSYTYVNNLPGLVAALAHYAGDSLFLTAIHPVDGHSDGSRRLMQQIRSAFQRYLNKHGIS